MNKVVLIENKPNNTLPIVNLLQANGYEVIHAADVLSGLWYVENAIPDLIVVDIALPELSDTSITARLNHLSPSIPIFGITTTTSLDNYLNAVACGCKVVFTQPVDIRNFLQEIAGILPVRV